MKLRQKLNPTDEVSEIIRLHEEIMDAPRAILDRAIRVGELLTKEQASLRHGDWKAWVEAHLPFTDRSARNYMRVYQRRNELAKNTPSLRDACKQLAESQTDSKRKRVSDLPDTGAVDEAVSKVASGSYPEPGSEDDDPDRVIPDPHDWNEVQLSGVLDALASSKIRGVTQDKAKLQRWVENHVSEADPDDELRQQVNNPEDDDTSFGE